MISHDIPTYKVRRASTLIMITMSNRYLQFVLATFVDVLARSSANTKDVAAEPLSSKNAIIFSGRNAGPLARALCVGKDTGIVKIHGSGEAMGLASFNAIRSMAYSGLKRVTIVNPTISLR